VLVEVSVAPGADQELQGVAIDAAEMIIRCAGPNGLMLAGVWR
jgi:hypothetical protein